MNKIVLFAFICLIKSITGSCTSYEISTNGNIIKATGDSSFSSTDASLVIQRAIDALTKTKTGGSIHIAKGSYFITKALLIVGWEKGTINNTSQIVITGDGWATKIIQTNKDEYGIVVKNGASFVFSGFIIN